MCGIQHIQDESVDIRETNLQSQFPELLKQLLIDHTTQKYIFWASNDYKSLGEGYDFSDEITPEKITGDKGQVIMPRILKKKNLQDARVRDKAEVFTPSWLCNSQNNLVDNAWFGREGVFNTECFENLASYWVINEDKVKFPRGKSWKSYVLSTRLEITCGEAPYLVSRYDTTTGDYIPVRQRIGMLDRKLRIVAENTSSEEEWREWAKKSYQSIYGYEWQGDSLLLAREALLFTYVDFYADKFLKKPSIDDLLEIADVISWNIWQMDGIKGVVPNSCHDTVVRTEDLFEVKEAISKCAGCKSNDKYSHNGVYCKIKDWKTGDIVRFVDILNS